MPGPGSLSGNKNFTNKLHSVRPGLCYDSATDDSEIETLEILVSRARMLFPRDSEAGLSATPDSLKAPG